MADKSINELNLTTTVQSEDLLVLEQDGEAKAIKGQSFITQMLALVSAHGGIKNIVQNPDYTITVTYADNTNWTSNSIRGEQGTQGIQGETGNGIANISKTSSSGHTDTYTVTFTDGTSTTFEVVNGTGAVSSVNDQVGDVLLNAADVKVSNRNLLDNPWFTVNQRNASIVPVGQYGADRWKVVSGNVVFGPAGVDITRTSDVWVMAQILPQGLISALTGSTVTVSALDSDNNLYALTVLSAFTAEHSVTSGEVNLWLASNGILYVGTPNSAAIKAVKLELGNVSTLAYDTAPDYGLELLKCQRYYLEIKPLSNFAYAGYAYAGSSEALYLAIVTPVVMRTLPTISMTGQWITHMGQVISQINLDNYISSAGIQVSCKSSGLVPGSVYRVVGAGSDAKLSLSADL